MNTADLFSTQSFSPEDHTRLERDIGALLKAHPGFNPARAQKILVAYTNLVRAVSDVLGHVIARGRWSGGPWALWFSGEESRRRSSLMVTKTGTVVYVGHDKNDWCVAETMDEGSDPNASFRFEHPDLRGLTFTPRPAADILAYVRTLVSPTLAD